MINNKDKQLTLKEQSQLEELLSGNGMETCGIKPDEIKHLAWLGAQVPNDGYIVEVGSHRGKSICAITLGALSTGNTPAKIHAVDLWLKGAGRTFSHQHSEETWRIFNEQLTSMGVADYVTPVMNSSEKAAERRKNPIHLLFIDGNHKETFVRMDYRLWYTFIPSGGYIAFHDYSPKFPGVKKVVDTEVIPSGLWEDFGHVGSIWSAKRNTSF